MITSSYAPRSLQRHLRKSQPPTFNLRFKKKQFCNGSVEIPSPKIVKYLPKTYKKLYCKGEPNRFSGQRDPSRHTKKLTILYTIGFTLVIFCIEKLLVPRIKIILFIGVRMTPGREGTFNFLIHQSPKFMITLSYLLDHQLWGLLLNFDQLVH